MPSFSKILLFLFVLLWAPACTVYTEKQTEAVSRVVYATKDSIDKARFDLADSYINETTRLVRPPKNRIPIESLIEPSRPSVKLRPASPSLNTSPISPKTPVIIVPERLRGLRVVVVNSEEYEELIQDKQAHEQLKLDFANLREAKQDVDKELIVQATNRDKMVKQINSLKESISNKNAVIVKLSLTCMGLGASLIAGIVLRIKGIL